MIETTLIRRDATIPGMWIMTCPRCKKILAGALERWMMPEFATCNCDDHDLLSRKTSSGRCD